ncbi:MAG: hypothetical protein AABW73_04055 [Nanoarchaeota archaeon]
MNERRRLSKLDLALLFGGSVMAGTYYGLLKGVGDFIGPNEQGAKVYDPELLGPTAVVLGISLTAFGVAAYLEKRSEER